MLPKDYARPALDKQRLGELIDLIGTIGLGDAENRSKDILGRVYEYFLSQFASRRGQEGRPVLHARARSSACWSRCSRRTRAGSMTPAAAPAACSSRARSSSRPTAGGIGDISIYGQESNPTTWRLAKMNLAIRGIDGDLGAEHADSFHRDLHPDLKADYVLANPPFNDSDWGGDRLREDMRWKYGTPPAGNANFAWVQHFIHHLAPSGMAGFVLANGSMSSNQSGEGEIRKALVEADLVDCMVALPGQLFYSTQIPVCLWFLARNKRNGRFRDRRGETLFIDARKLGTLIDRVHRELTDEDIARIADTYHAWRGDRGPSGASTDHAVGARSPRPASRRTGGETPPLRGRAWLLQERDARRDPLPRPRPHARPLRRRRGSRGRGRAVRGEDGAADGAAGGAVRGVGAAGAGDQAKPRDSARSYLRARRLR